MKRVILILLCVAVMAGMASAEALPVFGVQEPDSATGAVLYYVGCGLLICSGVYVMNAGTARGDTVLSVIGAGVGAYGIGGMGFALYTW